MRSLLFQAEDGIRYLVRSRGLGDVYKRQFVLFATNYLVATIGALIGSGGKVAPFGDAPLLLLSLIHI